MLRRCILLWMGVNVHVQTSMDTGAHAISCDAASTTSVAIQLAVGPVAESDLLMIELVPNGTSSQPLAGAPLLVLDLPNFTRTLSTCLKKV